MNENIDFLRVSPIFTSKLQKSAENVLKLREHIRQTRQVFDQYAQIGGNLCQCMEVLAGSFKELSEFENDSTMVSIHDLLLKFVVTMKEHYKQVKLQIITHLDDFMTNDIGEAETKNAKVSHEFDILNKALDNYDIQKTKKKKAQNDSQEKIMKLIAMYWDAGKSVFELNQQLELVERKKLIEITASVCFHIKNKCCHIRTAFIFNFYLNSNT